VPADRVGHDPGRHLEQHHPAGEEGVGGERLQVRELASSRKIVLMPQMNDDASVFPSMRPRYVR
jgi:hypothetical protein